MNSTLNKTSQYFRCVGHLYESSLKREEADLKQRNEDGSEAPSVKGERIMGNIAVETDSGIHTFNIYAQNLTSKGEESPTWKMYCEAMEWNPKVNGNSEMEPTLVNVEGTVEINDYVSPTTKEVSSSLRWRVSRANTKADPEDVRGTTLKATLFIGNIRQEVKNEEETGRLLVTLYGVNGKGECFPVEAIIDAEMADDFTDAYEIGMTVPFEFELKSRQAGGNTNATMKFGHKSKGPAVNQSYSISELFLVGGSEEIEEPDELTVEDENGNEVEVKTQWIDPKVMKKAVKLRQERLDQLKAEGPKTKSKSASSSLAAAKKASKTVSSSKFGKISAKAVDDDFADFGDDDDLPF